MALAVNGFGFFLNAVPALGMPMLLVHHLHAGAGAYGAILAASGTGALLGNAVAARNIQTGAFVTRFCLAWAVAGLLLAATGMASTLGWMLALSAGSGCRWPVENPHWRPFKSPVVAREFPGGGQISLRRVEHVPVCRMGCLVRHEVQ
jgi:hypothetical protein